MHELCPGREYTSAFLRYLVCAQLFLAALAGSTVPVMAQDLAATRPSAPEVRAVRATGPVRIDGRLDEGTWQEAPPQTEFVQTEPAEGEPASQRMEVRVLFDDDALYIGARLWEATGRVTGRLARRDLLPADADAFWVAIDSYRSRRSAFQFGVNPAGVMRDEITTGGIQGDAAWDAVWEVATSVDDEGWTAEFRIPIGQLRFTAAPEQIWGIQFTRRIHAAQEIDVLAFTPKRMRGGVANFSRLVGLEDLPAGKRIELLPYLVARAEYLDPIENNPFQRGAGYFGSSGIDLKARLNSGLTIDLTFNPDFGQVDADPAVVNLTAFETSFQEKRPFFLEGVDVFSFGDTRLFYSRRIGRAPQGRLPDEAVHDAMPQATTILGAAKITGRTAGGWTIGLIEAVTGQERAPYVDEEGVRREAVVEGATNYLVGRVRKDLREGESRVGAMATAVNRAIAGTGLAALLRASAYAGGIDFSHDFLDRSWTLAGHFAAGHVTGSAPAILRAQLASSRYYNRPDASHLRLDSTRTTLTGYSARLQLEKEAGRHWRGGVSAHMTTPGYEINDLGFESSVDRRGMGTNLEFVQERPGQFLRSWSLEADHELTWNFAGDLIRNELEIDAEGQLLNYWSGNLNYERIFPRLDDRLTRGGPLGRAPAAHGFSARIKSDVRSRISGTLRGDYLWNEAGGRELEATFTLQIRPSDSWNISLGPVFERGTSTAQYLGSARDTLATRTYGRRYLFSDLKQVTASMEARLNMNFSPRASLELYVQPFIATGEYGPPRELQRPRTFEFHEFGRDIGTLSYDAGNRTYTVDPDGPGPAPSFTVGKRDFEELSLRSNAVLRWEWRPGSTLFVVWQQERSAENSAGDFDLTRGIRRLVDPRPINILQVKLNYWINL